MKPYTLLAFLLALPAASVAAPTSLRVEMPSPAFSKASLEDFREPGDRGQVEVLASSWLPSALDVRTASGQTSPFNRVLPAAAVSYITTPYLQGTLGSLSLGMGVRFAPLERQATVVDFGVPKVFQQSLYIGSIEGRLIARPSLFKVGQWQLELGVSLLPTLAAVTPASIGGAEQNAAGAMVAGQGILSYSFPSWKGAQLRLGVEQTLGGVGYERRVSASKTENVNWDLSGFGANLGLRFPL